MTSKIKDEAAKAKAPRRMPRPEREDLPRAPAGNVDDKRTLSPLGMYFKLNNISTTAFAKGIGLAHKTVLELRDGKTVPLLEVAYEIERVTKGVVPMEAWLGTAKSKAKLAAIRAKQPEAIKHMKPVREPGGFAQPTKVKRKTAKLEHEAAEDMAKDMRGEIGDEDEP